MKTIELNEQQQETLKHCLDCFLEDEYLGNGTRIIINQIIQKLEQ